MNMEDFKARTYKILDQLESRIAEMKVDITNIAEDAKIEYADQIEKLSRLRDDLAEKLAQFDSVTDSKWSVIRESASSFFKTVAESWKYNYAKIVDAFEKERKDK